jgi:hypothetical protein
MPRISAKNDWYRLATARQLGAQVASFDTKVLEAAASERLRVSR